MPAFRAICYGLLAGNAFALGATLLDRDWMRALNALLAFALVVQTLRLDTIHRAIRQIGKTLWDRHFDEPVGGGS